VELDGSRVSFDVDTAHLGNTIEELSRSGILALTSHPPTLEELFLRHYGAQVEAVPA
jgi:ABC-2 type transport system ATP-binding protein